MRAYSWMLCAGGYFDVPTSFPWCLLFVSVCVSSLMLQIYVFRFAEAFTCAGGSARVALGSGMAHPRVADAKGDDSCHELFALRSAIGPNAKSCSSLARNFHKITAWKCASVSSVGIRRIS